MDIVSETKAEFRFRQWTKIIQECQASNLTVKAWCSQHNVGIKSYYYWLRKIRLTYCQTTGIQTPAVKQESYVMNHEWNDRITIIPGG